MLGSGTRNLELSLQHRINQVWDTHLLWQYSRVEAGGWTVAAHACNPGTLGGRGRQISKFEASLVYRVSSRAARAIHRNPVSNIYKE